MKVRVLRETLQDITVFLSEEKLQNLFNEFFNEEVEIIPDSFGRDSLKDLYKPLMNYKFHILDENYEKYYFSSFVKNGIMQFKIQKFDQ